MSISVPIRLGALIAGTAVLLSATAMPSMAETIRLAPVPGQSASDQFDAALARARAAKGSTILLAPGIYRLTRPLSLSAADAGATGAPLRIVGAPGGDVILTGGGNLEHADIPANIAALIPAASRSHVQAYRLPPAAAQAFERETSRSSSPAVWLTEGSKPLTLAGWPSDGYYLQPIDTPQKAPVSPVMGVTHDQAVRWAREPALRGAGFWTSDWYYAWDWVRQVDPSANVVRMPPLKASYSEAKRRRFRIANAFGEINRPGDYAIDPKSGILVAWPFDSNPIEIAAIDTIIQISNTHDISIDGIALRSARANALTVDGSSRISVANAFLGLSGGSGVAVTNGTNVSIARSVISDTGLGGVRLAGGDTASLTPGNDSITDSIVTRAGLLGVQSAIEIAGVGQTVSGNYIADITKAGVEYHGNDHHIAGNEITAVNQQMGDFGALYTYGNLIGRGTVIEQNYVHDIRTNPGMSRNIAVYLDGYTSGITVRHNLFADTPRVVLVNSGSDNVITDNLFVRPSENPIDISDRAWAWAKSSTGANARKSLDKASPAIMQRYGEAALTRPLQTGGAPTNNTISGNIVIGGPAPAIPGPVAQRQKIAPSIMLSSSNATTPTAIGRAASSRSGNLGIDFSAMDRRQALAGLRYK